VRLRAKEKLSGVAQAEFRHSPPGYRTAGDWPVAVASASSDVVVVFTNPKQRGITNLNQVVKVNMASTPRWVRVRSAAGNWSSWHKIS
jgi:hypothetical protein